MLRLEQCDESTNSSEIMPGTKRPQTRYQTSRPPIIERPNSVRFQNSITYQGPKLWADLSPSVKNLNDSGKFDYKIRRLINVEMLALNSV